MMNKRSLMCCIGLFLTVGNIPPNNLLADENFTIPEYKDFPKKGVNFRNFLPIFARVEEKNRLMEKIVTVYKSVDIGITAVVGLESRGFIIGADLAARLNVKFIPIRKAKKLPGPVFQESYLKEYGEDVFEISQGDLDETDRVIIVDDLIATGGSAQAAINLVEKTKAQVLEFMAILNVPELAHTVKLTKPLRIIL